MELFGKYPSFGRINSRSGIVGMRIVNNWDPEGTNLEFQMGPS
jgi:hypothetical protein